MGKPTRTCIGCRQRGLAEAMVRLALEAGRVVPWFGSRPPGRGASIHPVERCVREAVRIGAFSRAFRAQVEGVEVTVFLRRITEAGEQRPTTIGRTQP